MNFLTIERLILNHLKSWQYFDANRLARDNRNFTPPADGIWGRVTLTGGINQIRAVSSPCVLETGTLIVQLFCRENTGTVQIKTWADSLAGHLAAKQLDRLDLLAPSIINLPIMDGLYQINVSVPYRYY